MEKIFTISAFTENNIGLLGRITIIFTRRRINIDSLTVSETEFKGVSRFTIVVKTTRNMIDKLVNQINKIVEVLTAFAHEDDKLVFREIALYKVEADTPEKQHNVTAFAQRHEARIIHSDPKFIVLEKTGHSEDLFGFLELLKPHGILEFLRSGRIAIHKGPRTLDEFLPEGINLKLNSFSYTN